MRHSRLASPSATRAVLEAHGLATKKALGQHLLVDDNVIGRILALAGPLRGETVLEVGPGIGTLTVALCERADHVIAVERDDDLLPVLAETTAEFDNLRVVHADAVRVPLSDLTGPAGPPSALVANLPYGVAATVVLRFMQGLPSLRTAVVMVQSEVADRMSADPGRKDYGAYTVKLGLVAKATERFNVARSCFMPPPNVDSAVIRLDRVDSIGEDAVRRAGAAADAAFAQRRKTLRNSIASAWQLDTARVAEILSQAGIDAGRRAETLGLDEFVRIGDFAARYGLLP